MLNDTRLEVYLVAYITRLQRGETLDYIDEFYLSRGRVKQDDINQIHEQLQKYL